MVALNFDARKVDPLSPREPLPAGDYRAAITASGTKPTKKRDGEYLELELTVIDGEHKGRKIWDRLNIKNPNQTAVEIAYRTLSAICHATGVMTPNDSSELHDIPFIVTVVCKKSDSGNITNEVKGYKPRVKGAANPAASAGDTPPWARTEEPASNDGIPF